MTPSSVVNWGWWWRIDTKSRNPLDLKVEWRMSEWWLLEKTGAILLVVWRCFVGGHVGNRNRRPPASVQIISLTACTGSGRWRMSSERSRWAWQTKMNCRQQGTSWCCCCCCWPVCHRLIALLPHYVMSLSLSLSLSLWATPCHEKYSGYFSCNSREFSVRSLAVVGKILPGSLPRSNRFITSRFITGPIIISSCIPIKQLTKRSF